MSSETVKAVWAAVGPFIGTLVGAWVSIWTVRANNERAAEQRRDEAKEARAVNSRDFQRETLLKLQDALQSYLRFAARQHIEDEANFRAGGKWGRTPLSQEVNSGLMDAGTEVLKLVQRVLDDALRNKVVELNKTISSLTFAKSFEESERILARIADDGTAAMAHIGTVLRALL